jgi:hypothetical protein
MNILDMETLDRNAESISSIANPGKDARNIAILLTLAKSKLGSVDFQPDINFSSK